MGEGGVKHFFVTPPNPDPHLFEKRRVIREELINGSSHLYCPALSVPLETRLDIASKDPHKALYPFLYHHDYFINEVPGLWIYLRLVYALHLQVIGTQ